MDELDLQHFGSIFTFGYTQPHCKYENSADLNETNNKVTIILEIGEKSWVESFIFFPLQKSLQKIPASLKKLLKYQRMQKCLLTRQKIEFCNKNRKCKILECKIFNFDENSQNVYIPRIFESNLNVMGKVNRL